MEERAEDQVKTKDRQRWRRKEKIKSNKRRTEMEEKGEDQVKTKDRQRRRRKEKIKPKTVRMS